jgi:hypothetical protein
LSGEETLKEQCIPSLDVLLSETYYLEIAPVRKLNLHEYSSEILVVISWLPCDTPEADPGLDKVEVS